MSEVDEVRIGPAEAVVLIRRIRAMVEPDRRALWAACYAKCPPGKNKQLQRLGRAA